MPEEREIFKVFLPASLQHQELEPIRSHGKELKSFLNKGKTLPPFALAP